jgi:predicted permease
MKLLAYLRSVGDKFLHRSRVDADLEEELRSHIQLRADDLERSGMSRAQAERLAQIEFAGSQRFKEECHEQIGGNLIETLSQDARFSLRLLRKSPGFTVTAIVTLALGIGANAVVFSMLNAFILHPLYVPQTESLYGIWRSDLDTAAQSYPNYLDMRDRNRSFDDLVAYQIDLVGMDTGDNPSQNWIETVSGNYFDALHLQPAVGRFFNASDEHGPNSAPFIVLAYAYWHSHFQNDPGVIGRVVLVNKNPFTVIGVAPPDFNGTLMFFNPDFFVPLVNQEQVEGSNILNDRKVASVFMVLGHLKSGVTPAQATADLQSVGTYLKGTYSKDVGDIRFALARPGLYGDHAGRPIKAFLTGLLVLAALILLAACANLGSLFAARAADRSREVALRLALGASRVRVLRQLYTEAILISILGGAAGLWGGIELLKALSVWQPVHGFPLRMAVTPDASVYGLALLLAIASGFLFGSVPIKQILGANPYELVKAGVASSRGRRMAIRDLLVVGQIAICAVLVTSSFVAVRGLVRSFHSRFGFEPRNAFLVGTDLMMGGHKAEKIPAMQKLMIDSVAAIPGVRAAGLTDRLPLSLGSNNSLVFTDQATDLTPGGAAASVVVAAASPEYFTAAGTALLSGRGFTWMDNKDAPRVAIVNPEFAAKIFGSAARALGSYYKIADGTRIQVVGVVEQGKYDGLTEDPQPAMFFPLLQFPASGTTMVVRSDLDPEHLAGALRSTLRGLDSGLPVTIDTWERELDLAFLGPRLATQALGVMGLIGALLSVTGIFGMAAYSVSKRLREFGIRIALGANRSEVLRTALGREFKLLALGSAAGVVLGIMASRVLAFIVDQATPRDPVVLVGVVVSMALLGLIATFIPARRAMSVDPSTLLREE